MGHREYIDMENAQSNPLKPQTLKNNFKFRNKILNEFGFNAPCISAGSNSNNFKQGSENQNSN